MDRYMALTLKKNTDGLKKLKNNIGYLKSSSVEVGIFADKVYTGFEQGRGERPAGHNAGVNVATIAQVNEIGGWNTPSRPFRKETIDSVFRNKQVLGMELEQALIGNVPKTTQSIGKRLKELMHTIVDSWVMRDSNSPETVKEKGFNKPLEWTGKLLDSIDYRVKRRV